MELLASDWKQPNVSSAFNSLLLMEDATSIKYTMSAKGRHSAVVEVCVDVAVDVAVVVMHVLHNAGHDARSSSELMPFVHFCGAIPAHPSGSIISLQ
jgi:hypothetical protein